MNLERNIIKITKKRKKLELKLSKLKVMANSLKKDIQGYESQIVILKQSDLLIIKNASDLEFNELMLESTKSILKNVENQIAKKTYEYTLLDKALDNFKQLKEKIML